MTSPTDTVQQLHELPDLAAQAVPHATGRRGGGDGIRTAPGSKPPPGVDLDAIDVSHGRQHPHLLARLSGCVRAVVEERRRADLWHPEPVAEEDVSWASEVQYLLDTADWWTAESWCTEWIATEVGVIHGKLTRKAEELVDSTKCPTCGGPVTAHTTDTLMVAQCEPCQRVLGMRPRKLLTTRQAAERHGVTPQAIRTLEYRGRVLKVAVIEGTSVYDETHIDAHFGA